MMTSGLPVVVALVGPTGVGKTEVSLQLAELLNAEIISADSMQIYRGMDIGTAKATPEERSRVTHHLIDILDPGQSFSVAQYQQLAREAIASINVRGKLPLLVGGSGLYLRATLYPYQFTDFRGNSAFRLSLEERAAREGSAVLHAELSRVDPLSAAKLHHNDARRIIRALEVYHYTGRCISTQEENTRNANLAYNTLWYGLDRERAELYSRIDRRVEEMLAAGLLEEVSRVRKYWLQSESSKSIAGQALGYKELLPYLDGMEPLDSAVDRLKRESRRYARRQLIWFRGEKRIEWFILSEGNQASEVAGMIADRVRESLMITASRIKEDIPQADRQHDY
ncbi:MAG: tRNA (adenosine(37)-N6)-dimethylallyltransferase MiaA [Symbiobacteriaceae bacterium]|nr:tRNA (adenosine(37)-N6)-dimethylallyltransferase MiaA [Symbiobacteriaceae bacterium]